mmetsp:Transcript_109/g.214  ORF Transcript_109/g.214 Transcript_109/m.214 type:complete len:257 (-) Transcript_109:350-1120(-)
MCPLLVVLRVHRYEYVALGHDADGCNTPLPERDRHQHGRRRRHELLTRVLPEYSGIPQSVLDLFCRATEVARVAEDPRHILPPPLIVRVSIDIVAHEVCRDGKPFFLVQLLHHRCLAHHNHGARAATVLLGRRFCFQDLPCHRCSEHRPRRRGLPHKLPFRIPHQFARIGWGGGRSRVDRSIIRGHRFSRPERRVILLEITLGSGLGSFRGGGEHRGATEPVAPVGRSFRGFEIDGDGIAVFPPQCFRPWAHRNCP